jgi:hypothetical protein
MAFPFVPAGRSLLVIASEAIQTVSAVAVWIASSQELLAMTA